MSCENGPRHCVNIKPSLNFDQDHDEAYYTGEPQFQIDQDHKGLQI